MLPNTQGPSAAADSDEGRAARQTNQFSAARSVLSAGRAALSGTLPPRYSLYDERWAADFAALAQPALCDGTQILDVGAGRRPTFPAHARPRNVTYVGLDRERTELASARADAYDEVIESDICTPVAALHDRFDLIASWQVLEHVPSLQQALDNFYAYLRPGGYAIAMLSGRYSVASLLNLLFPSAFGVSLVSRAMRRPPDTVFKAHYDRCFYSALVDQGARWSYANVIGAWAGARYFGFWAPVQAAYVMYEEWARLSGRANLATHYYLQLRK